MLKHNNWRDCQPSALTVWMDKRRKEIRDLITEARAHRESVRRANQTRHQSMALLRKICKSQQIQHFHR